MEVDVGYVIGVAFMVWCMTRPAHHGRVEKFSRFDEYRD